MFRASPLFSAIIFCFFAACGVALGQPVPDPPNSNSVSTSKNKTKSKAKNRRRNKANKSVKRTKRTKRTKSTKSTKNPPALPRPATIRHLKAGQCHEILKAHKVKVGKVPVKRSTGVDIPVKIVGPIGGIEIFSKSKSLNNRIIDCRIAVAILAWNDVLEAADIVKVVHRSTFRPGARIRGRGKKSGHASAMAIDIGSFVKRDGSELDVEQVWAGAKRGADPCIHPDDESDELRVLRSVVCDAADIFQVIITPHHDNDHYNHVHFELRPNVTWSFIQ